MSLRPVAFPVLETLYMGLCNPHLWPFSNRSWVQRLLSLFLLVCSNLSPSLPWETSLEKGQQDTGILPPVAFPFPLCGCLDRPGGCSLTLVDRHCYSACFLLLGREEAEGDRVNVGAGRSRLEAWPWDKQGDLSLLLHL